jgi:sigma-B regulation protein RsbU (phosphoserine phosphatase)
MTGRRPLLPLDATLVLTVTGVLAVIVGASQALELFINRVLRPDLAEWRWISESLLVGGLIVITTLWTRLRLARTAVAELERRQLTIDTELAVAATVQQALLPPIPAPMGGIAWYAAMEPAGPVGGDYYDFFSAGASCMCVVIADVSGKGVPAAVFMSNTRAILRAVAREQSSPRSMLAAVSETILLDGRGALYVTCFIAIVDTARRMLRYVNAGHPPPVVLGRELQALTIGGPPLGLLAGTAYEEGTLALQPGDLVLAVSDGVTDALGASGNDIPAAIATVVTQAGARTPVAACAALLAAARTGPGPGGGPGWSDDRTVLAFGVTSAPSSSTP